RTGGGASGPGQGTQARLPTDQADRLPRLSRAWIRTVYQWPRGRCRRVNDVLVVPVRIWTYDPFSTRRATLKFLSPEVWVCSLTSAALQVKRTVVPLTDRVRIREIGAVRSGPSMNTIET